MSLVKIRWQGFHQVTRLLGVPKDTPFLPTPRPDPAEGARRRWMLPGRIGPFDRCKNGWPGWWLPTSIGASHVRSPWSG
jgi:hypothetical protein